MPAVNLIKGDSLDASGVDYRDSIPVNMYGVLRNTLGSAGYMYQMPGLASFGEASGIDRGGLWVSTPSFEGHYRVSGNDLVSIGAGGSKTVLGTVPGNEQVPMDFTFNNVILVADKKLYYYNPTDGFRQITDGGNVVNPISVVFVAQFVVLTDGERIYHSQILNEENFPLENEAVAEFSPDKTLSLKKNDDNELVVFGEFSIEHFVFNGAPSGFAFTPLDRKASKLGVSGTLSLDELEAKWYLVGRREETAPSCYMYSSGTGKKIASREIEQVLEGYTDDQLSTTTIDGITLDKVGLVFYHFPNETYLFNVTLAESQGVDNAWSLVKTGVNNTNYRARSFVRDPRIGEWIIGDKTDSSLGIFDKTVSTQYDEIAEWLLFTPFLNLETLSIDQLEIETIPGIVHDIEDATVFVSRTENGRTYGQEWTQLYGDQWQYSQRFYIRRFGYVRHWMGFKFRGASRNRMAFGLLNVEVS
ncbi:MAG: packaged DNA stabilization protein [Oleispira sp.]